MATINGTAGNDTLEGTYLADDIHGGEGDDVLRGGDELTFATVDGVPASFFFAYDFLYGDTGNDILIADNNHLGFLLGPSGGGGGHLPVGNLLDGGAGDDLMYGGGGDETYYVDSINDQIFEPNYTYLFLHNGEIPSGTGGIDTVYGSVSYSLPANVEILILTGAGNLNGTGNDGDNTLTGTGGANILQGLDGDDIIFGESGDDVLIGDDGNDMLMGETGAPSLLGGNDELRGGNGNDMLDGGAGDDIIFGGAGNDLIHGDEGSDLIVAGPGVDFMLGSTASAFGPATSGGDLFVYTHMGDAGDRIWGFDLDFATGNDGIDLRPLFDGLGYTGINPRGDGYLYVFQNGLNTDIYVDADGAANGANLSMPLLSLMDVNAAQVTDSYFLFQ